MRTARGFTFIELMIASVVFLLAVGGTFSAMGTAGRQFEHQRKVTMGLHLAEFTIEELLLRFQSSTELAPGSHARFFRADGTPSTTAVADGFTLTWVVKAADPLPKVRKITVTSSWTQGGQTRKVSLFTYRP